VWPSGAVGSHQDVVCASASFVVLFASVPVGVAHNRFVHAIRVVDMQSASTTVCLREIDTLPVLQTARISLPTSANGGCASAGNALQTVAGNLCALWLHCLWSGVDCPCALLSWITFQSLSLVARFMYMTHFYRRCCRMRRVSTWILLHTRASRSCLSSTFIEHRLRRTKLHLRCRICVRVSVRLFYLHILSTSGAVFGRATQCCIG
jgi:hypothetical protein